MNARLTLKTRDLSLTEPIETLVRERTEKLERYYDRLLGCAVTLSGPGARHKNGGPYGVRIDLAVPGSDLVVNRSEQADLQAALRDAFDAAERQLQTRVELKREVRRV
jgi:ribosomal subunit interface protein